MNDCLANGKKVVSSDLSDVLSNLWFVNARKFRLNIKFSWNKIAVFGALSYFYIFHLW
jgi:hypothetical protein